MPKKGKKNKRLENIEKKVHEQELEGVKKEETKVENEKCEAEKQNDDKNDNENKKHEEIEEKKEKEEDLEEQENKEEKQEKKSKEEVDEEENETKQEKQLQKKTAAEMQEVVGKEMKENRKLPDDEMGKINTQVFQNICLAIVIMFYLNFLILGFFNIQVSVFATDLKVFSVAILLISIGIFEYAYKKDSPKHIITAIEILVLALSTMACIYVNLMWSDKFVYIVSLLTYIYAIYYVAKSIIIYQKMKKEYFIEKMKKIIKK